MTTNIDRAADIIDAWTKQGHELNEHVGNPHDIARALAKAGLLAPEKPEPQTFPSGEREWSTLDGWVNLDTDGTITMAYDERDEDDLAAGAEIEPGELVFTRISEARDLANILNAAANHAEGVDRADA